MMEKVALFLEQTLITDVPLRVVRAAAAPVRWRRIAPPAAVDLTHDARCRERED